MSTPTSESLNTTDGISAEPTGASAVVPTLPMRSGGPFSDWLHRGLYDRVIAALHALPTRFVSPLVIEGVSVTDLFTMNTPLGAAIEVSVVDSLNGLRSLWDPDGEYAGYIFVRQAQTFPDVLLKSTDPNVSIDARVLMGIELKGWFAIAKEGEPSYRYYASVNACAPADLLVVVPWVFDSIVSGKPRLLQPIITEARFAAEMRNYYWEHGRSARSEGSRAVVIAPHAGYYPNKNDQYSDRAENDNGGNFGRIARCNVMDEEVKAIFQKEILGVPLTLWQRFLTIFSENRTLQNALNRVDSIGQEVNGRATISRTQQEETIRLLSEALELLKARLDEPIVPPARRSRPR